DSGGLRVPSAVPLRRPALPDGGTTRDRDARRPHGRVRPRRRAPRVRRRRPVTTSEAPMAALLEVAGLDKTFHADGRVVHAVEDVGFTIARGETLGLVGRSGAGKTTVARLVLRLLEPDAGSIRLDGLELVGLHRRALRRVRPRVQMVFQDPA